MDLPLSETRCTHIWEAIITYCLGFTAALFCLDSAESCRELVRSPSRDLFYRLLLKYRSLHVTIPGPASSRRARSHRARSKWPCCPYRARILGESLGGRLCSPLGNGILEPKFLFLFFGLAEKCFSRNSLIPLSPRAGRSSGPAREAALGMLGETRMGLGEGKDCGGGSSGCCTATSSSAFASGTALTLTGAAPEGLAGF